MSERFDELSRHLANRTSRRGVLKLLGAGLGAGVAAAVLKPFRGDAGAVCGGSTNVPCGAGTTPCGPCCCQAGIACVNASTGKCGCPAGTTACGSTCCASGESCVDPSQSLCQGSCATCTHSGQICAKGCKCFRHFENHPISAFFCSTGRTTGPRCVNSTACPSGYLCADEVDPCVQKCPNCP
jgi:hypothetical protein